MQSCDLHGTNSSRYPLSSRSFLALRRSSRAVPSNLPPATSRRKLSIFRAVAGLLPEDLREPAGGVGGVDQDLAVSKLLGEQDPPAQGEPFLTAFHDVDLEPDYPPEEVKVTAQDDCQGGALPPPPEQRVVHDHVQQVLRGFEAVRGGRAVELAFECSDVEVENGEAVVGLFADYLAERGGFPGVVSLGQYCASEYMLCIPQAGARTGLNPASTVRPSVVGPARAGWATSPSSQPSPARGEGVRAPPGPGWRRGGSDPHQGALGRQDAFLAHPV